MNHDGVSDGLDIQLFVHFALMVNTPDWRDVCSGDLEIPPDQMIDNDDVVVCSSPAYWTASLSVSSGRRRFS
ncbi:MAG: hypothetical protein MI923_29090 [Phycisphaerales bacterium]|nr:hypothetical protein [Phycisphaerales bacterium]